MSVSTSPPPGTTNQAAGPTPPRRKITLRDLFATLFATAAALAIIISLRQGLHGLGTLTIALAGYVVFAGMLVVFEFAGRGGGRRRGPAVVSGDAPTAPTDPVLDLTSSPRVVALPGAEAIPPAPPMTTVVNPELERLARRKALNLPEDPAEDRPIRRRAFSRSDLIPVSLAALAATAFALIVRSVWSLTGPTGTILWWYVAFVIVFFVLIRDRSDRENAIDRIVTLFIWSIGALVVGVLGWMITFLVAKGLPALRPAFFTSDLSKVGPLTPGGGAYHAIIGTAEQVALATIVVVPIAVLTAVYLHEMKGRLAKPVRVIVDAMSGLPSIVAGLLIFAVYVDGRGFSGVAGSAALVVLMLPTVTRASEEILRTIPDSLREASMALGAPQWRVVLKVVLPTARAGLVTAVILGIARGVGETAPMLLTAFGSDSTNTNPLKGPQEDLPLFVWKLIRLPNQTQNNRGWTGLLILVLLVLILFTTARYVSSRADRKLGRMR